MDYQRSIAVSENTRKSLETAKMIFMQNGFALLRQNETGFEVSGPGMSSTHQNPITGVSKACLNIAGKHLKLEVELGGVRWMQWFLYLLPLGLFVFFLILLVGSQKQSIGPAFYALSPWVVLSPLMGRWIRFRTIRALDTLLENAAMESKS